MGGYISPAQEAGMELENFLATQVKVLLGDQAPLVVYHYTSAEGMLSILRQGVLRAMPLSRMNDMAEARFAASVFRGHLDRQYALEKPGPFFNVLSAMRQQMNQGIDLSNVYSASFSSDGDEEGMWRLYAHCGTGFSFCIPLFHGLRWSSNAPWGDLWKCHYGEVALKPFCETALSKARELFRNRPTDYPPSTVDEFAKEFLNRIAHFAPAFKPEIWANELEWRWIFVTPPEDKKPFIDLPLQANGRSGRLAISSIFAGPHCEKTKIDEVRKLLDELGLAQCRVHCSIYGAKLEPVSLQ